MEFLTQNAEGIAALLGILLTALWSWIRTSEWFVSRVNTKLQLKTDQIYRIASATVYRTYVEIISRGPDKIDSEHIRSEAWRIFQEEAGPQVAQWKEEFGESWLKAKIDDVYKEAKAKGLKAKTGTVFGPTVELVGTDTASLRGNDDA